MSQITFTKITEAFYSLLLYCLKSELRNHTKMQFVYDFIAYLTDKSIHKSVINIIINFRQNVETMLMNCVTKVSSELYNQQ